MPKVLFGAQPQQRKKNSTVPGAYKNCRHIMVWFDLTLTWHLGDDSDAITIQLQLAYKTND